ncbi:hypothetical protein GEMRC1_003906 [Eukaryota sp. GEM-RC1]
MDNVVEQVYTYNNKQYTIRLRDAAGLDSFSVLSDDIDCSIEAVLFVFAQNSQSSLDIVGHIYRNLQNHLSALAFQSIPVVLVGNKRDTTVTINLDQCQEMIQSWNNIAKTFVETYAYDEADINHLFDVVLGLIDGTHNQSQNSGSCVLL